MIILNKNGLVECCCGTISTFAEELVEKICPILNSSITVCFNDKYFTVYKYDTVEAIVKKWIECEIMSESHSVSKIYRIYYKHNSSHSDEATEEIFNDSFDANQRCFELNEHSIAGIYGQFSYKEELK